MKTLVLKRLRFLKEPTPAPAIKDPKKIDQLYTYWRMRTLYAAFIGYAVFYFCRKNLSAATPGIIADLGYSKTQIGMLWSGLYLTYGVGKLANGVLGDRANSQYFMAIGLIISAIANILFGMSSSLLFLGIFWCINGWVQATGGPTCAKLITNWFSGNERGTKWAIWNTSHQIGGGLIMMLGGYLTQYYGWRSAFIVPAVIATACAIFLINRLRDTPEVMGLPAIEDYRNDRTLEKTDQLDSSHPVKDILFDHVLKNRDIWLLAFANFFVYLVRYGAMDWAPTYLVEVKGSSIANASYKVAMLEFAGVIGSLIAGWLSDKYFPNRRSIINIFYMFMLAVAVCGFWMVPKGHPMVDATLLGAVGFLVYGPQMLVGVCAADAAGKHAAGTANGMTGLLGYLGSIFSGVGTGWAVDRYGWNGGFILFIGSALLGCVFFVFTSETRREKRHAKRRLKVAESKRAASVSIS